MRTTCCFPAFTSRAVLNLCLLTPACNSKYETHPAVAARWLSALLLCTLCGFLQAALCLAIESYSSGTQCRGGLQPLKHSEMLQMQIGQHSTKWGEWEGSGKVVNYSFCSYFFRCIMLSRRLD